METPTLLGYLARFGSFSTQSELLCTQGLAYLLQTYDEVRSVMAGEIRERTGVDIGEPVKWLAESLQDDMARPDLEACTADGVPVVKIEAKLGAELFASQLRSYAADLRQRNSEDTALLVLVPEGRSAMTAQTVMDAFGVPGTDRWRISDADLPGSVTVSVISWDELFTTLKSVVAARFAYELEQLQAMYRVLSGDYIAPLASNEDLQRWKERETDFVNLVDQATRRLTTDHGVYPMGTEALEETSSGGEYVQYRRRYVCQRSGDRAPCYSIGVRDSFAEYLTPVWMRFHKDTAGFSQLRQRIKASNLRSLESGGHLWLPLDLPINASGDQMVQALIDQVQGVLAAAL